MGIKNAMKNAAIIPNQWIKKYGPIKKDNGYQRTYAIAENIIVIKSKIIANKNSLFLVYFN